MEWLGVKGLTWRGRRSSMRRRVLLLLSAWPARGERTAVAMAVAGLGAIIAFAASDLGPAQDGIRGLPLREFIKPADGKITSTQDGKTATISVVEVGRMMTIRTNGKPDAACSWMPRAR
jgi:hypothetical protein